MPLPPQVKLNNISTQAPGQETTMFLLTPLRFHNSYFLSSAWRYQQMAIKISIMSQLESLNGWRSKWYREIKFIKFNNRSQPNQLLMLKCKKPIYCLQVWKKLMTLAVCTSRRKRKSTPTLENLVFFFFFSLLRKKKG